MPLLLTGLKSKIFGINKLITSNHHSKFRAFKVPHLYVGEKIVGKVSKICIDEYLYKKKNILIITGNKTYDIAASSIERGFKRRKYNVQVIKKEFQSLTKDIVDCTFKEASNFSFVVGVGGGSKLDLAKIISQKAGVPYVLVPTTVSHDGIASNFSSFYVGKKKKSVKTHLTEAVFVDFTVVKRSKDDLLKAGIGDILSNYSSANDWMLANKKNLTKDFSNNLCMANLLAAQTLIEMILYHKQFKMQNIIKYLTMAAYSSACVMSIIGSTQPSSGSEHKIAHFLEKKTKARHGELVGWLTIPMACLQKKYKLGGDWKMVKHAMKKAGLKTKASEFGLTEKDVIEAIELAKNFRKDRYTILNEKSTNQIVKVFKSTNSL